MNVKETVKCELCGIYHCNDYCIDCLPIAVDEALNTLKVPRNLIDNSAHYDHKTEYWHWPSGLSSYFDINTRKR